jgi:hypothetical protein
MHGYQRPFGQATSCADSFPLYTPEYVKHQQDVLSGLLTKGVSDNTPDRTQKKMQKHVEQIQESFTNVIPSNDPTSEMLLDLKERPLTDFYHNNMVPFYRGNSTHQNMAGTGVASGSYIDGSNVPGNITGVNSGFDYTTPYKSNLATFTGLDDTYLHKREVGPMFSPAEQQTGWVYGSPLFRPDMDRYTQGLSQIRNDLSPVEKEMIGPGLNLDPSIPATGGFHDFTRILPNNVNDYKANQLPGQVIEGKLYSAGLPSSYPGIGIAGNKVAPGVTKNKPNSFWDQVRYPTMTTKVGFQNNLDYNIPQYEVDFKPNNASREQISYGLGSVSVGGVSGNSDIVCTIPDVSFGTGPLGSHIPVTGQRSETYMSQDNNIRSLSDCNSLPIGNPSKPGMGESNTISNWYVNETDRGTVNPQNVMQLNISAEKQGTTFWTYDDEANTTTKETTTYAYSGNSQRSQDGYTFWTHVDEPKTTTKSTTEYSYASNPTKEGMATKFWTYTDETPTTTKETTVFAYNGDANKPGFADTSRFMFTGN